MRCFGKLLRGLGFYATTRGCEHHFQPRVKPHPGCSARPGAWIHRPFWVQNFGCKHGILSCGDLFPTRDHWFGSPSFPHDNVTRPVFLRDPYRTAMPWVFPLLPVPSGLAAILLSRLKHDVGRHNFFKGRMQCHAQQRRALSLRKDTFQLCIF